MMSKNNRIISWLMLIVFSFVIFGSSLFIIAHTAHNCTGEYCSVCMELADCHKILQTTSTAVAVILILLALLFAVRTATKVIVKTVSAHATLISLKVELLN